jgi:hypothetical protein
VLLQAEMVAEKRRAEIAAETAKKFAEERVLSFILFFH